MATESRFQNIVWSEAKQELTPRDVRRHVQLASVLEPVSEKEGCTTRSKDLSEQQKLEYFLTAGVNIGDAFEDLAQRISTRGFPCETYDLCYRAQADSKKNRRGGRINQGIIEFLFPIVISQVANKVTDPNEIIDFIPSTLAQTASEDTVWLQRMQNLAFEMSGRYDRMFAIAEHKNIQTYYCMRLNNSTKPSDTYHNYEIVANYPTLQCMIDIAKNNNAPLSESMKFLYNTVREKEPEMPKGMIADLITCTIYLLLTAEHTAKIAQ